MSGTIFEGHHRPLLVWVVCLYLMGLNLSNEQIATELDLPLNEPQALTRQLLEGMVVKKPVILSGEVESDEVYITAGHKGHPQLVAGPGRKVPARWLRPS